jgi:hypothetical protein
MGFGFLKEPNYSAEDNDLLSLSKKIRADMIYTARKINVLFTAWFVDSTCRKIDDNTRPK